MPWGAGASRKAARRGYAPSLAVMIHPPMAAGRSVLPIGATLRFWSKDKVGRLHIFQLKLVQNYLTKKSCKRVTKKFTRTPSFFCQNGQKLSELRLIKLARMFYTIVFLVCALKYSYYRIINTK